MQNTILFVVAALLGIVTAFPTDTKCNASPLSIHDKKLIQSAFTSASVVPDLIPSISPEIAVGVRYGAVEAELGNFLLPNETKQAPSYTLPPLPNHAPATTNYTVMILDANNPLSWKIPTLLYMGYNHRPTCITTTPALSVPAPYGGPDPLGALPHRYVILVYLQTRVPFVEIAPGLPGRYTFPLKEFVQDNGLRLVGGAFFREMGLNATA